MPLFDPTIPQPGDFVSDSQQNLLDNNVALNDSFSVNHIPLNQASHNGKHKFVQMRIVPIATVPAIPGTETNEGAIFTQVIGGRVQLFYTDATNDRKYQLTNVTNSTDFAKCGQATNGWTWLGQGIILQYGFSPVSVAPIIDPIVFSVSFVGNPYSIQFSPVGTSVSGSFSATVSNASISNEGFSISQNISGAGMNLTGAYWTAVGAYAG